jgi:hypothetical protein
MSRRRSERSPLVLMDGADLHTVPENRTAA